MLTLSIIIPVFNESQNILPMVQTIGQYIQEDYRVVFVDDGSSDSSLEEIVKIATKNPNISAISLSRNFSHQNALYAGLQQINSKYYILMDGDLQHPASLIPEILNQLESGYDIVNTKRNTTQNIPWLKKITTALFYNFINSISRTRIEPNSSDFRGFNHKVKTNLMLFKERDLFLRGLFSWMGFKQTSISFDAPARHSGKTKYSMFKMARLALKGTISFSFKPLRIAILFGSVLSLTAFGFAIFALIAYYGGDTVPGWASTIIAVMLLGGTQLLAIGLMGEYIAGIFTETKNRPLYLIDKKINLD